MKTIREFSSFGPCVTLGTLVRETVTRIVYRSRDGKVAWVSKSSRLVHREPCLSCRDYERSQYPDGYWG